MMEATTRISTQLTPLVTRWEEPDGPVYLLELEDANVSVRLTEDQVRGLGARILTATMDDFDD